MRNLMSLIENGETYSTAQLAAALNLSVDMIAAIIERYEQLGYLRKVVLDCKTACRGGCSKSCALCQGAGGSSGIKGIRMPVTMWEVVKKN